MSAGLREVAQDDNDAETGNVLEIVAGGLLQNWVGASSSYLRSPTGLIRTEGWVIGLIIGAAGIPACLEMMGLSRDLQIVKEYLNNPECPPPGARLSAWLIGT